jgi:effector-binding domain-containing protein
MHLPSAFRLILAGMIAAAVPIGAALAQSPAPAASPTATPSASPSPAPAPSPAPQAAPAPSPSASPTSSASPSPAPSAPPASAQAPATPPAADPFGEPVTLEARKVVTVKGNATWDGAFDALIDSFKTLSALLDKQGVKPSGNGLIVYTSTDDSGFTFIAEIPVSQDVKTLGKNMSMGQSPEGKSLKFVHRGSYDNMDNTYEAITNHLDEKKLEAKDLFIEEYITDPLKTAEDKLVINVYVPLK